MRLLTRLRGAPRSVSGRVTHDPMMTVAATAVTGSWALTHLLRRPAPPAARDHTRWLTVTDRRVVAQDENVVAVTLADPSGAVLPAWRPGAHLDLHLPSGRLRQYSLCGDPACRDSYRIAVRRIPDGAGGSIEVHDGLPVGTTLAVDGPRNAFPLAVPGYGSPTERFRFVAGGIGITPILPMLALADRLGVDWSMIYVGRSRESIPFVEEVARFGDRIRVRTDDVDGVPSAEDLLGPCPDGTTVYACGPAPMLTVIRRHLSGRDDVELHFERFAAAPVVGGRPFSATIASSGARVRVGAEETLLAALRRSGIDAPYSCQQGFCGTCRTRVLEGVVDHRDGLLTEPEHAAGLMLTCVSRAEPGAGLVLDL